MKILQQTTAQSTRLEDELQWDIHHDIDTFRVYAEINLAHVRHNLLEIEKFLPAQCKIMAVVKADAYGHGGPVTAGFLEDCGVSSFAVAELNEAISLRKAGIKGEILIMGRTPVQCKELLIRYRLTQSIISEEYAKSLCETAGIVRAHIKIDTGMNRLGERAEDIEKLMGIYKQKGSGLLEHTVIWPVPTALPRRILHLRIDRSAASSRRYNN